MKRRFTNFLLIGLVLAFASGCGSLATIAVKDVQKTEAAINTLVINSPISVDCKAGWASGALLTGTSSDAVKIASAMVELGNQESEDFVKCRMGRLQVSFMIKDGVSTYSTIMSNLIALGIVVP